MRIVVFGAGSLGSAIGALLSRANEVALVGRHAHMSAVRSGGLRVVGDVRALARVQAHETLRNLHPPDLLLLTTKAYDTIAAIAQCRNWASSDTKVLTFQNGLGNLEALRDWKGRLAFGGTTTMGANLLGPGLVKVSGLGRAVIGSDCDSAGARVIARTFRNSGLPTVVRKEILGEVWAKAVVSACINPLTAILRVQNGQLMASRSVSRLASDLCDECERVARAHRVRLPGGSMVGKVRAVARSTAGNRSSMLQDIERSRQTEIGQINGKFVSLGLEHGIRTPLNLTMLAMVESLEGSTTSSRKLIS